MEKDKEIIEHLKKDNNTMLRVEILARLSTLTEIIINNNLTTMDKFEKETEKNIEDLLETKVKKMSKEEKDAFLTIKNSIFGTLFK